jgi:hypothetical protein
MKLLLNTTGSKGVKIVETNYQVMAFYLDIYNGEEQVLQTKEFKTVKNAEKWASKILN